MGCLSIIVPCYDEEKLIPLFYDEIIDVLSNLEMNYEIIFVNDGSTDNTLKSIKKLPSNNVNYISFSRNFGKESALFAGLEKCSGDYIAVMDVDLQDPPSLLPEMLDILFSSDYDVVATRRVSRKGEPVIRSFFARFFYKVMNKFSDIEIVDGARDYRVMTKQVKDVILQLREYNRFSKGLFSWVGFNIKWIEYENVERVTGETSWSFLELFKYSIEGIVSFTTVPLSISSFLGVIFSISAFILLIIIVLRKLFFNEAVQGWTSIISLILLLGGIQLFSIGILGKYLGKTYTEAKNRPIYIIKESNIDENEN